MFKKQFEVGRCQDGMQNMTKKIQMTYKYMKPHRREWENKVLT